MRTQNQPSNPLLLFDTYPPNGELPYRPGAASEAEIIFDFVGSNVNLDLEYMGTLPQDALLDYAIGMAKDHGIVPPDFNVDRARRQLTALRNNLVASSRYAGERYDGTVVFFSAENATLPVASALAGWGRLVASPIDIVNVGGRHTTMFSEPFVSGLASDVQRIIDGRRRRHASGE